jgi:hypothetical protein
MSTAPAITPGLPAAVEVIDPAGSAELVRRFPVSCPVLDCADRAPVGLLWRRDAYDRQWRARRLATAFVLHAFAADEAARWLLTEHARTHHPGTAHDAALRVLMAEAAQDVARLARGLPALFTPTSADCAECGQLLTLAAGRWVGPDSSADCPSATTLCDNLCPGRRGRVEPPPFGACPLCAGTGELPGPHAAVDLR